MAVIGNEIWSGTGASVNDSVGRWHCQTFTTDLPFTRVEALLRSGSASAQITMKLVAGSSPLGTVITSQNVFIPQTASFTGVAFTGIDFAEQPAGTYTLCVTKVSTGSINFFVAQSTANPYPNGNYILKDGTNLYPTAGTDLAFRVYQTDPPAGPAVKRWTGSEWVSAVMKKYDGTTWVTPTITKY